MPWPCLCAGAQLQRCCSTHGRQAPTHSSLSTKLRALLLLLPRRSSFLATGETAAEQRVMGWPGPLDCGRQQLQHGQQWRSLSLVCAAGAQDVCAITLCRSLWPIHPSLFVASSSHGRSISGQIWCSSYSSIWTRSASTATASVDSVNTQTTEELWEEYFAHPSQWWDNRVDKRNPRAPDLKHKATRRALWIDGWSTPAWVKARLRPVTQGSLQWQAGYGTKDLQGTAEGRRLPKRNNDRRNALPTSARELREAVQGGDDTKHLRSTNTTSEAIVVLKNLQQQGISIDSYMYVEVLKLCLKQKDLIAAKQVHACILKSGMDQHSYVANNLLSVYIRCGRLPDARRVFDALVKKDVISWNVMIGGYAQHSNAKDAMEVFKKMVQAGVQPNEVTFLSILKACASPSALKWGKEVHAYIRHGGLESDARVGTALLKMYAKCGCMKEARQAFGNLTKRDVISWTVMIGSYAESGCGEEAYRLFLEMKREGFEPNAFTYVSILNARASAGALEWVKEVHSHASKAGLESDFRVGSALVHMYAKSGSIDDAREVFERMEERDVITWTVMIGGLAQHGHGREAYELFVRMQREGCAPNVFTYASILNACPSAGDSEWVKEVHSHAMEAGLETDLRVGNALVHLYAKSGSIADAREVFDRMEERDVVTWTVMIGGLAQHGHGHEAYEVFLQMQREGCLPNAITYLSILNACASAGALAWVREVHSHAVEAGFESDLRVGNALVHMYAKSGSVRDARQFFDRMEERDVLTWTVMIGAYAESGCGEEAYGLFLQMKREGFQANAITYVSILSACASAGAFEWVKEVHRHAVEAGFETDLRVGNALVHMYAKSGNIDEARLVFDRMEERDVVTWTAMIGGLAQHGFGLEALESFRNMIGEGVKPDGTSFVAVLSACSHTGLVDDGRRLFLAMTQDYGIEPVVLHYNCMVDLLGRAGHLEEAKLFIGNMPVEPNVATWGALLGACRIHGNVELAEHAATELLKLEPNLASTYVLLSNIYAAAGMWKEVSLVRNRMRERGICKEPGRSWIEVDNEIHDFVVGDTSHPESKEIYAELKRLSDRIKAEGYIPDTRLVLKNIEEEDKELALCSHSEKLAIAYGLMRTAHGKPIRVYKNLRVCPDCHTATKFISKVTGREIVARDANRFHHFKDGVCSCGDYW